MKKGRSFNELQTRLRRRQIRLKIYEQQSGLCYYCFRPCKAESHKNDPILFTLDHIVPVAHGGTDKEWNLVGSCYECNLAKLSRKGPASLAHVDSAMGKRKAIRRPFHRGHQDRRIYSKAEYEAGVHTRLSEWGRQKHKSRKYVL